jgi:hypothetical protein
MFAPAAARPGSFLRSATYGLGQRHRGGGRALLRAVDSTSHSSKAPRMLNCECPLTTHCRHSTRDAKVECVTRSTISLAGYTFASDKGCFTCSHVMDGAPVLLFAHEVDGDLQFMCGASDHDFDKDCRWLHMSHVLEWQPDLHSLPTVDMGFEAERTAVRAPWVVSEIPSYN